MTDHHEQTQSDINDFSALDAYKYSKEDEARFLLIGLEPGESWFFWCLKGANINHYTREPDGWEWPPRLSGRIAAKDKKDARKKICAEFGEEYPMRVLDKERTKFPFLLYIEEIVAGKNSSRYARRFMPQNCVICDREFIINDHYSDPHSELKGGNSTCSAECERIHRINLRSDCFSEGFSGRGGHQAVIYAITHKPTQKRYIGKTTQAFTLRWYQHMYHPGSTEFHNLIRKSPVTDWSFEVIESTDTTIPASILRGTREFERAVLQREQYWIDYFDTVNSGLNAVVSLKIEDEKNTLQQNLEL